MYITLLDIVVQLEQEMPDVISFDSHVPCGCLAFCTYIRAMYVINFSSATRTFN